VPAVLPNQGNFLLLFLIFINNTDGTPIGFNFGRITPIEINIIKVTPIGFSISRVKPLGSASAKTGTGTSSAAGAEGPAS
jgi:hypothetical protein